MVSIAILSVAILGTFTAVQSSLQNSGFAKDQVTAFYLTQEAVEYIRNIRDTNAIQNIATPTNWLTGLAASAGDPCYFGKTCQIDVPNNKVTMCPGGTGSCAVLSQDSNTALFGYAPNWTPTRFKREIQFEASPDVPYVSGVPQEVIVHVTMSWTSGSFAKSFTVDQTLFNWH